jgi:DNA-binding protein HU-beta
MISQAGIVEGLILHHSPSHVVGSNEESCIQNTLEVENMPNTTAKPLGKSDISARVASKLRSTHAEGSRALNAVLEAITESLKERRGVTLTGFGTFDIREIKARKVRAIRGRQAGQMMTVPARKRPGFRAGSELQRAVAAR